MADQHARDRKDSHRKDRDRKDVAFLYEIGTLRHVQRTWRQFGGLRYANVAEHTMRVAWIAMVLAAKEGADVSHAARLALVHDIPESRTGDVNYVSRLYVDRAEQLALADMADGGSLEAQLLEDWEELTTAETLEAKVVKDADALDCDLELMESAATGASLLEPLRASREQVFRRLRTDAARAMFREVYAADPHAWHTQGRNRLTAGDWRPDD